MANENEIDFSAFTDALEEEDIKTTKDQEDIDEETAAAPSPGEVLEGGIFTLAKGAGAGLFELTEAGSKAVGRTFKDLKKSGIDMTDPQALEIFQAHFTKGLKESKAFLKSEKATLAEGIGEAGAEAVELGGLIGGPVSKVAGGKFLGMALEGALFRGVETESLQGAGEGALFGLGGQAAGKGLQAIASKPIQTIFRKVAPKIKREAAVSAAKSFKTGPEFFKKKVQALGKDRPLSKNAEELGEFILKNDLIKDTTEDSLTAASKIASESGQDIGRLVGQISERVDGINVNNTIFKEVTKTIVKKLRRSTDPDAQALVSTIVRRFDKIREGKISLARLNQWRQELDGAINWGNVVNGTASPQDMILVKLRQIASTSVDKKIVSSAGRAGPEIAKQLSKTKRTFQKARIMEDLAGKKVPRDFLSPEIHSKDLLTGMLLSGALPQTASVTSKALSQIVGVAGAGVVRRTGRKIRAKGFAAAEKALSSTVKKAREPLLTPKAAIFGGAKAPKFSGVETFEINKGDFEDK